MSAEFEERPYSDSHLDSPEYRQRLMRKLNTLIAVLEVACAKVRRSLAGPDADTERLRRIHKNLGDTLRVCMRARRALERSEKLPDDLPDHLRMAGEGARDASGVGATGEEFRAKGSEVELSSEAEKRKFSELGPIEEAEIRTCDLDELAQRLSAGE